MKKALSILLSICMLLSLTAGLDFSAYALDESGTFCGDVTWSFDSLTGELTISGSGYMGDCSEKSSPFYNKNEIKKVSINSGVTGIGFYVFNNCTGITSIEIPNSVTSIGNCAFDGCTGLSSITVDSNNTVYDCRDDCNAIITKSTNVLILGCKNTVIPNSVTSIGNYAFSRCTGLTDIIIPSSITSIGLYAFCGCTGLTSIELPNSITSIGNEAFCGCTGLTSIELPDSITSIGNEAFCGCTGLSSVTIGDGVTSIGISAFESCEGLTSISIGNSVTSIADSVFRYCIELKSIAIPNSVTSIGSYVFNGCTGLTSITVDGGNTVYDSRNDCNAIIEKATNTLVHGCKNTVIPNSVTSIGSSAFRDCTVLTSIEIPNSVSSIGEYAFYGCTGLTNVVVPNGVISIGDAAFNGCTGLKSIEIPSSVTSIGSNIFRLCTELASIVIDSNNSVYDSRNNCNAIIRKSDNTLLYGCKNSFIPNSVTSIGNYAFEKCEGLTNIEIPNSVTSIGGNAFWYCADLTNVEIPNSVEKIDVHTFSYCAGLTRITIPKSVTSIDNFAFSSCIGLKDVYYLGSESEWNNISIRKANNCLKNATIHFDYANPYEIHTPQAAVIENEVAATCKDEGSYDSVVYCKVCEAEISREKKIIAKKAHTAVTDKAVVSTFTKTGKTAGKHCAVCGAVIKAQKKVEKLGAPKISKLKKGKKKFTATWKPVKNVHGYQIQYARKKNMKGAKKKTVKGYNKNTLTVKKLKPETVYYVRIRAYKKINGNLKYSKWSKVVKVKTN